MEIEETREVRYQKSTEPEYKAAIDWALSSSEEDVRSAFESLAVKELITSN